MPSASAGDTVVDSHGLPWRAAVALGAVCLVVYLLAMPPSYGPVDQGELATACATLGIAHPPGFPGFVLLGKLATLAPLHTPVQRVQALSALLSAGAVSLLFLAAHALLRRPTRAEGDAGETPALPGAAAAAALLFGFAQSHWYWATEAEVYALNTLAFALIVFALARCVGAAAGGDKLRPRFVGLLGLGMGVGLANHPVIFVLIAPALALVAWLVRRQLKARALLLGLGGVALGLSLYAYLPLRAAQDPPLNWGDPSSLDRLLRHVTARQYSSQIGGLESGAQWAALREFGRLALRQSLPSALPVLALLGIAARRGGGLLGLFSLLAAAANVLFYVTYRSAGEDVSAYFLPTFLLLALWSAEGLRLLAGLLPTPLRRIAAGERPVALQVLLLAPLALLFALPGLPHCNKRDYRVSHEYVSNLFASAQPEGVILTRDWYSYSPALYEQLVIDTRPDLTVIDLELLRRRPWYIAHLRRMDPDLMLACEEELARFLPYLERLERHEDQPREEFDEAFHRLVRRIIAAAADRPVYVGVNPAPFPETVAGLDLVPEGLLLRCVELGSDRRLRPVQPALANLLARGRPADPAEQRIRTTYVKALCFGAAELSRQGELAETNHWLDLARMVNAERTEEIASELRRAGVLVDGPPPREER